MNIRIGPGTLLVPAGLPAEAAGLFPTGSGSPRKKQSFYL